jgi:hypothetical protein
MSETRDVALERIEDTARAASRRGTLQYANSIAVGIVVCAIKDKENI